MSSETDTVYLLLFDPGAYGGVNRAGNVKNPREI